MKKDDGAWSIPKGEFAEGEAPLEAAKREFREETGFSVEGEFQELDPIRQAGGKTVYAWAIQFDLDVTALHSNSFSLEWPPKSGKIQTFPEVDRAAWFDLDQARCKIFKGQMGLLDQFLETHANKEENT
jgi:predicted NUDIX family NTP pyrophosphohydrolase